MRVLLVIPEMAVGGAERVVIELARALAREGHPVGLAAAPGPFDSQLSGLGVARFPLAGRGRAPHSLARATLQTNQAIRRFEPDIIHAHNVKATGLSHAARWLARRRRIPLLATFQGVTPREERTAAMVFRAATEVACVSTDLARRLESSGFPSDRLRVIHNAVSLDDPPEERVMAIRSELGVRGHRVVAIVGRMVPQKAHLRFLEAARLVHLRDPGARFLIVGDGPLRPTIEREIAGDGLAAVTVLTGARSDAREIIAAADLLVFSSDWEGLSLAALEALAAGTPVVATGVSGMRELLEDGAGEVVPATAEGIADGVCELLDDEAKRRRMGEVGRAVIADRFHATGMVDEYLTAYRRLVDGPPPGLPSKAVAP